MLGGVLVLAATGSTVAAAASAFISALVTLLVVVGCVIGGVLVLGAVLAVIFRDRLRGMMVRRSPTWVDRTEEDGAVPPKTPRPAEPKHELHLHFHGDSPDAIRRAVEAAALAGGGTVRLPEGTFDMREKPVIRS